MANIAEKLNRIDSSVIDSVRIMELLDLNSDEFMDVGRFERFKDVMKKLSSYPDKEFLIKKVVMKKVGYDKLNTIWEYLKVLEIKKLREEELEKANESKDMIVKFSEEKGVDPEELEEYQKHLESIESISSSIRELEQEVSLYEN